MCSTSLNQTAQEEEIFNGYCFRQWWNEAVHTRKLIETLVENCLLTYNSLVSKKILLACTDYVLNQQYMPCEEACMYEIAQKVGRKFKSAPIEEIYFQKF